MPRTKKEIKKSQGFLSQIKWGESYTSLILGAVVVIVGLILLFSFLKARTAMNNSDVTSATTEQNMKPSSYIVKKGDDLWTIAKNLYGSGYNWVDLASANKLQNPSVLYVGTSLKVPDVKPKIVDQPKMVSQKTAITGDKYVVVKGDYLWDIAIRAYGDGYKWVEIARVNKLTNPNLIHSGNSLILPR